MGRQCGNRDFNLQDTAASDRKLKALSPTDDVKVCVQYKMQLKMCKESMSHQTLKNIILIQSVQPVSNAILMYIFIESICLLCI